MKQDMRVENSTCGVMITIRPIVTSFEPRGLARNGRQLDFPQGSYFTIDALMALFDLSRQTVHNTLTQYRRELEAPSYRQRRYAGNFRLRRIISERDFAFLRTIFPRGVKKKPKRINPRS